MIAEKEVTHETAFYGKEENGFFSESGS